MKDLNQVLARGLIILLVCAFVTSCASIPDLKVNYQLPPPSALLKGKKVFLAFEDARATKEILGKGASREFKNFPGDLTLSVARNNEPGFKIGIFQVSAMMREVFERRLENEGLGLLLKKLRGEPQLLIVLNEFVLDLVHRKWVVKMNYEARLVINEKVVSTQTISGQVERYRLAGWGAADIVLSEIFTDMVNRLDVVKLFQRAEL